MAMALRRLPVTAEDLVRSWTSPRENGYVETSTENGRFPEYFEFFPVNIILLTLHTQSSSSFCTVISKTNKQDGVLPSKEVLPATSLDHGS
jgi:hypothetical protein